MLSVTRLTDNIKKVNLASNFSLSVASNVTDEHKKSPHADGEIIWLVIPVTLSLALRVGLYLS